MSDTKGNRVVTPTSTSTPAPPAVVAGLDETRVWRKCQLCGKCSQVDIFANPRLLDPKELWVCEDCLLKRASD